MFTERLYRPLGLAALLGWARLLVNSHRDLVELPSTTREGACGRHHFAPDDEGAFEYEIRALPQPRPHPLSSAVDAVCGRAVEGLFFAWCVF